MIKHDPSIEEFSSLISSGKVIVDFWATWCNPCKIQGGILSSLESDHPEITIVKVDVDNCPELSDKFGISSIPTLLCYKDGEQVKKFVGTTDAQTLLDF